MSAVVKISLNTARLDRLRGELGARAERVLDLSAADVQANAVMNTRRVDTGAMKNGWRVAREQPMQRTIYNTQEYAIYHEMGTRRMSAAPMLVPAVERVRPGLADAWRRLFA